ncbi:hypothetical protein OAO01_06240 [Oligoflexia bacterium]|nr:hypothetical protein [Oligoflexia bacterium]
MGLEPSGNSLKFYTYCYADILKKEPYQPQKSPDFTAISTKHGT